MRVPRGGAIRGDDNRVVDIGRDLQRGRECFTREAWGDACESLWGADRVRPLGGDDLELLATSAYMIGDEAGYLGALERAYRAHLDDGRSLRAVRCAFWIGATVARRGETGRASGWLGRAQRLLDREAGETAEHGYLLLPGVFAQEAMGDLESAAGAAGAAAAIGERFGDTDLFALAAHEQGRVMIRGGRLSEGLALLDEAMVSVSGGELSPIVTGIVYCGVILACQAVHDVGRAQEWTAGLSGWCERQPDLVAFTGRCLVHRAELMQLHGAWPEALEEARRARQRCLQAANLGAAAEAAYREGEVRRLRGEFGAAEDAYRAASGHGREPQPGLALLRLAQGDAAAAEAAIDRLASEASERVRRAALLPAYIEIMLAVGKLEPAHRACAELESIAEEHGSATLAATAADAWGALQLAQGAARDALAWLRRAAESWQRLQAPYEAARVRELIGRACRALGDEDTATLELQACRATYTSLGALPDLTRLRSLSGARSSDVHGLTEREFEVLRRLASGETNKAIAAELVLSERTVDRHVSNIFAKLGVSSRAAATGYAYEHRLL